MAAKPRDTKKPKGWSKKTSPPQSVVPLDRDEAEDHDITGSTKSADDLDKIEDEIKALRAQGDVRQKVLVNLAKNLGRHRVTKGGELYFVTDDDPYPLSIPKATIIRRFTKDSILDQLMGDVERLRGRS